MNHPTDDELLLLAYEELREPRAAELEAHLTICEPCNHQFRLLTRARVATDWAVDGRRSGRAARIRIVGMALATAAAIAAIVIIRHANNEPRGSWPQAREWSANAGYFAGGHAMIVIDSQLTRLEQGWSYGRP
jgi:hypothetical protein